MEILKDMLYIIVLIVVVSYAILGYIDYKRDVKQRIEIHKLNIEKLKIEIEIGKLKKINK